MKNGLRALIDIDSTVLILGTMPGEKSIALQQYYGNPGNQFWKIVFKVFGECFSTNYEVRKLLLKRHRIALWNVLFSCEREGSQDDKIKNETPNDFESFHLLYPGIRHVFFESKAAEQFYKKHISPKPGIIYSTLPSTSGLNSRLSFDQKLSEWIILRDVK